MHRPAVSLAALVLCALVHSAASAPAPISFQLHKPAKIGDLIGMENAVVAIIKILQTDINSTKEELGATSALLAKSSAAQDAAVSQLAAELSSTKAEAQVLQARLGESNALLAATQAQLDKATEAHEAAISKLNGQESSTKSELQALQQQLAEAVATNAATLSKLVGDSTSQAARLQNLQGQLDATKDLLASNTTQLAAGIAAQQAALTQLSGEMAGNRAEAQGMQVQLAQAQADLQGLPSKVVWCGYDGGRSCKMPSDAASLWVGDSYSLRHSEDGTLGFFHKGAADSLAAVGSGGQVYAGAGGFNTQGGKWAIGTPAPGSKREDSDRDALVFKYRGADRVVVPAI